MLAYWIHSIDPFIIRFPVSWPLEGIRWYGVAYLISFLFASFLLNYLYIHKKITLNKAFQQNFLVALFFGILIGGRLGFVFFYYPAYYLQNPTEIFQIWKGGMSCHGGFIGVLISLYIFSKKSHLSLLSLCDLTIPIGTFGIFLGRCANFINGEVYGTATTVSWGVIFNHEVFARHPSQLYEALLEGIIPFILSCYVLFKRKRTLYFPGLLASRFLVFYGIVRYLLEYFREPDAPLIGILTRGQFYSIFTFAAGLICAYYVKKHETIDRTRVFTH